MDAVDAALSAFEAGQDVSQASAAEKESLPRWSSSLQDIQAVSADVLGTNNQLIAEKAELEQAFIAIQEKVARQRQANDGITAQIEQLRSLGREDHGGALAAIKSDIADRARQLQLQQKALGALQLKEKSALNRFALTQLQVAGLEVDKQARIVDMKARDQAALESLRTEVASLRERVAQGQDQTKLLRVKTDELYSIDEPYIAQAKEIIARNVARRSLLNTLKADKARQQAAIQDIAAKRAVIENDRNVKAVQRLLAERALQDARAKEAFEQLEALEIDDAGAYNFEEDERRIERIERQNAAIEHEIANLRENIALLEYKVNGLERYKGRNTKRR